MANPASRALPIRLRQWATGQDGHVRAAVELLIKHGFWLDHPGFIADCVSTDGGESRVHWASAAAMLGVGATGASSSQRAVLDLAVALGSDRYRLSLASDAEAEAAVRAVATATGMEGLLRG